MMIEDYSFCTPFINYMNEFISVDEESVELISEYSREIKFPKHHLMLNEGLSSESVYFIVSGEARSFYTDFHGKTTTWSFHFNNENSISRNLFAFDYRAFLTKMPSSVSVEALSEVTVISFSKAQVDFLLTNCRAFEQWTRKLNETAFINMYDRAFTLLTMTASERYNKLLKEEPHLLQMFSNYYIASYLGIAPQSLRRIRNQK